MNFFFKIVTFTVLLAGNACNIYSPSVTMQAEMRDGVPEFQIKSSKCNGLLNLSVWSAQSRDLLWSLKLDYLKEGKISYGKVSRNFEIASVQSVRTKQRFPQKGAPPQLSNGGKYYLSVTCQYDSLNAPSVKTFYFSFVIDSRGEISHVQQLLEKPVVNVPVLNERP